MGLHFYPFSSCFFESIRPTLLCWLPVFCEDIFDQVHKIPSAIYIHESPLRHFFLQLSKLWTTIQCMLHIFRVFSTNITAAVLDNLSSNRLSLVGKEFLVALQTKFFTLLGTGRFQIACHNGFNLETSD